LRAFEAADDQGIQFVAAAADDEDFYDAPDNTDGEAPAEAEFDAEAEALSLRCAEAERDADAERRDSPIYNSDFRVPVDYDVIPGVSGSARMWTAALDVVTQEALTEAESHADIAYGLPAVSMLNERCTRERFTSTKITGVITIFTPPSPLLNY